MAINMAKILVVDDEFPIRDIIRQTLEFENHVVREASNGLEALASQKADPAEIMLIDIIMPEKEGIETIMEIRQSDPDLKIIAMSGAGLDSPYLVMAQHLGANITLDKPFSTDEVLAAVNAVLAEKG